MQKAHRSFIAELVNSAENHAQMQTDSKWKSFTVTIQIKQFLAAVHLKPNLMVMLRGHKLYLKEIKKKNDALICYDITLLVKIPY